MLLQQNPGRSTLEFFGTLKELCHGWFAYLEKVSLKICPVHHLQYVPIFSILNHPCSFIVYYYLFGVFLS